MDIVAAVALVVGVGLVVMSVLAWIGRLDLFSESIRLNHAGLLLTVGAFCVLSSVMSFYTTLTGNLLPGTNMGIFLIVWMFLFFAFIYMYVQTPQKFMSRMGWANRNNKELPQELPEQEGNESLQESITKESGLVDASTNTGDDEYLERKDGANDWVMVDRFDEKANDSDISEQDHTEGNSDSPQEEDSGQ